MKHKISETGTLVSHLLKYTVFITNYPTNHV